MSALQDRARRWGPPAAVLAFAASGVVAQGVDLLRVVAALLVVASLALTMTRPSPWALPVGAILAGGGLVMVCNGSAANVGWFALVLLCGWVALVAPTVVLVTVWFAAESALVGEALATSDSGWLNWLAGASFATLACWLGRRERERADQLRAAQHGLAERARTDERGRIAREIHDVVAHALTVSLLHTSGARLALADGDREEAERMLADAERTGRTALTEVRQAVGLLRSDTGPAVAPVPDARAIGALVESVRAAGAEIDLVVDGELDDLPATTGLALYRILQESLTNAVRHAPGAITRVRVTRSPDGVVVEADTGPVAALRPRAGGTGLASMRERAEALGGTCTSGSQDGLWRVRVQLPVRQFAAPPAPEAAR